MLPRQDVSAAQKESSLHNFVTPPLHVVVVDSDQELRHTIVAGLRTAGYRVQAASGANSAKALLADQPPALVLTELWMPDGNGWDLLLHCQMRWPLLPVLLMSKTSLGQQPEIECWAAGFLPKPVSMSQLLSEVSRLAARRTFAQNPNLAGLASRRPAG